MANELQPLSLLFQNRLFRIPDYQRGYAWQQSQLADFWDDLINLQQDRYHYIGLLSLKSLGRKETKDWGSDLWMVDKGFKANIEYAIPNFVTKIEKHFLCRGITDI